MWKTIIDYGPEIGMLQRDLYLRISIYILTWSGHVSPLGMHIWEMEMARIHC